MHVKSKKKNKTQSTLNMKQLSEYVLTCTILLIIMGSILRGNLSILNNDSETKAFFASKMFSSLMRTYVAKETNDT